MERAPGAGSFAESSLDRPFSAWVGGSVSRKGETELKTKGQQKPAALHWTILKKEEDLLCS